MFFLAVLTWATLTTEPPKVVRFYKNLGDCLQEAQKQNHSIPGFEKPTQWLCLEVRGDT